jgi:hypothetical protein
MRIFGMRSWMGRCFRFRFRLVRILGEWGLEIGDLIGRVHFVVGFWGLHSFSSGSLRF